jgi:hypothetical protein
MKKRKPTANPTALSATRRRQSWKPFPGSSAKSRCRRVTCPKGRAGRKGVVIYLDPIAKDLLAELAHERRKTLQELGIEAFNHLFRAYGQKPLA